MSVTKISEVVEYVLFVHNDDVAKPRALNPLIPRWTGRAGLDKRLIKNKKILSELLEKEKNMDIMKTQKTALTRDDLQTTLRRRKQLLIVVSPKSLKTVTWKPRMKKRQRIASLKAHHSYRRTIQMHVNTVKA